MRVKQINYELNKNYLVKKKVDRNCVQEEAKEIGIIHLLFKLP